MRRLAYLSIAIMLLLPLLVFTGVALADLSAQEMPLSGANYPREINPDSQGNLWITDLLADELWWVNAAGNASKVYPVSGHPWDASPDNLGRVWWVSGTTLSYLDLSDNSTKSWTVPGSSSLSGISIDATGLVWMSDSGAANVYSFDITDRNTLCTYPLTDTYSTASYPFAIDNQLWLADSGTGALVRLDYATDEWTRWALPDFSTPYDLIVDGNGDVWYTDNGLYQIGKFHPSTHELSIFPIPISDSEPVTLASTAGCIWYADRGTGTLGFLDPTIMPPTPLILTLATANANSSCSRLGSPTTGSATPVDGTPSWTSGTYPIQYNANGWIVFELPTNAQPWGITFTTEGYVVDSFRHVLMRFTAPTAVDLLGLTAASEPRGIQLSWRSAQETDLLGFNLFRADALDGPKVKLNPEFIPALNPGELVGNHYQYLDATALTGKTYYYWVEWVAMVGSDLNGPVVEYLPWFTWLPSVLR